MWENIQQLLYGNFLNWLMKNLIFIWPIEVFILFFITINITQKKREGQEKYDYTKTICLDDTSIYLNVGWKLFPERKGGVKTTDILEFYDEFIKDKYKNHLVIMDNAVIHKSKIIRETIENSQNELLYSVPYHPETNSIEEFLSQLKHYIKRKVQIHMKIFIIQ